MRRISRSPLPLRSIPATPFQSAEEAWFWYIRCQKARDDGARPDPYASTIARPCDPDDLYRAVKDLTTRRRITHHHVRVLSEYGYSERPPDPRCREEQRPYRLWNEALDRLTTVLKHKEILE